MNYNAVLMDDWPAPLWAVQRGLYYGDALFESVRVFDGRVPLLEAHCQRLRAGMEAMGYHIPESWTPGFWEKEILRTISTPNARVRITVWRSPGGLYLPENDDPLFLITATAMESSRFEWVKEGLTIGCCSAVRLPVDALSGYKTLNAARYVAAAREARARGWDDALLLNAYDKVCEATSSNVFWFEGDALCTPPLSDGCVTGTMRNLLLLLRAQDGLPVQEKSVTFAALLEADEVFLTNAVRGIRWVHKCKDKVWKHTKTSMLFQKVVDAL